MRITCDPAKRAKTFADRGLDFADAATVFAGVTLDYTPRGAGRHIFSMRKANEREQSRLAPLLEI
jgi:uncharacterized DUF497 family protein